MLRFDFSVRALCSGLFLVLLTGCATLKPDFETPVVSVTSFKALPSESMAPRFEIGLNVQNPNPDPLKLKGVAYTISLEGREIINGVGNNLPAVEAYGQADMTLEASASLFEAMGLFRDLIRDQRDTLNYEFEAKLDPGGIIPAIRVTDKGTVSLRPE